jgi:hypothetical protein
MAPADEIDALYGLPLEEFTRARNELAKRVPEAKSLAKPSLGAWAANQAARRDSGAVKALLDATDQLREAYGGGADVRDATRAERDAMRRLDDAATAELEHAGRKASSALLNRVRDTIRAAAADPDARPLLERGTLTQELESTGFGALAGLKPTAAPTPVPDRREVPKLRRRVRTLEAQARKRAQAALVAEGAAERAQAAAEKAARKAAQARDAAEHAEAALNEARAELESTSP